MAARAAVLSVACYMVWIVLVVPSLADAGIRCDCSFNGLTGSAVGVICARPNSTETVEKAVRCEKVRYGAIEPGYVVNPDEARSGYKSLYRLYRTSRNWVDASESCWKDGGQLAVPATKEELYFLAEQLRLYGGGRTNSAMLGVRRPSDEQAFLSVTGEDMTVVLWSHWRPGEEYSVPGKQCLEMFITKSLRVAFRSRECGQPAAYFCERPLSPPVSPSYTFVAGLGFYMPSGQLLPYRRAEQQCQTSGGHLVVADTQQEADVLMKGFDLHPLVEQIYVGIDDRREAGVFQTIHGDRLEWLDFQNWAPSAQEARSADIHCMTFTSSGGYQLVNCDTPLPAICEWNLG